MCKYCEGDLDVIEHDNMKAIVFVNDTEGSKLQLYIDGEASIKKSVPIRFCPICGRNLIMEEK